jgi:hypothetical protein
VGAASVAQCALAIEETQSGASLPSVSGAGDATVTTPFAAFELTGLIEQTLEGEALAQRHVTVGASDLAAARQDYEAQLTAAAAQIGSPCNLTGSALIDGLPKAFLDRQARTLAFQEKVEEVVGHVDVSPAALLAYYNAHQSVVTQVCVNLIVATDQAAAQAIHDKIAAGTSWADSAAGPGVNPGGPPGGQGPCVYPSDLAPQLGQGTATVIEGLADGQLAPPQPISIQGQTPGTQTTVWTVIGVRQHHLVPFTTAAAGLRQGLLAMGGARLTAALDRIVRGARVEVDPQYGRWSTTRGVVAPTPPKPAYLLNPASGQASGGSVLGSVPGSSSSG